MSTSITIPVLKLRTEINNIIEKKKLKEGDMINNFLKLEENDPEVALLLKEKMSELHSRILLRLIVQSAAVS